MTVLGVGAIGGTVAAFLSSAGEKVIIVDQSTLHIEAIRSNGLLADGVFEEQRVKFEKVLVPETEGIVLELYDRHDPRAMLVRSKEDLPRAFKMLPTGSPKGNSGIWLDIKVRHRKTETEFVTGEVVRLGRKHGLPMTINAQVTQMIKEIEEGQRPMSWDSLRSLEKLADARLPD